MFGKFFLSPKNSTTNLHPFFFNFYCLLEHLVLFSYSFYLVCYWTQRESQKAEGRKKTSRFDDISFLFFVYQRLFDFVWLYEFKISNLNMPWLPAVFLTHILTIVLLRVIIFCGPYSMRATILRRMFVFMGILYVSRGNLMTLFFSQKNFLVYKDTLAFRVFILLSVFESFWQHIFFLCVCMFCWGLCLLSTTLPRSDTSYPEPDYDPNDSIFYNGLLVTLQIKTNAADMCNIVVFLWGGAKSQEPKILTSKTIWLQKIWLQKIWLQKNWLHFKIVMY